MAQQLHEAEEARDSAPVDQLEEREAELVERLSRTAAELRAARRAARNPCRDRGIARLHQAKAARKADEKGPALCRALLLHAAWGAVRRPPYQTPAPMMARARIGTVASFSPAMFSRESPTM